MGFWWLFLWTISTFYFTIFYYFSKCLVKTWEEKQMAVELLKNSWKILTISNIELMTSYCLCLRDHWILKTRLSISLHFIETMLFMLISLEKLGWASVNQLVLKSLVSPIRNVKISQIFEQGMRFLSFWWHYEDSFLFSKVK